MYEKYFIDKWLRGYSVTRLLGYAVTRLYGYAVNRVNV